MQRLYNFALAALLVSGCGGSGYSSNEYFNDMDQMAGWGGWQELNLTDHDAHSGRYSSQVDGDHPFGVPFIQKIRNIAGGEGSATISAHLEMWVKLEDAESDGDLVVSTFGGTEAPFWDGTPLLSLVKEHGSWQRISRTVHVPAATGAEELRIYLHNGRAKKRILVDDVKITLSR